MQFFENQTILVPFDFSDLSTKAIQKALEMTDDASRVHVIHVVDPVPAMVAIDLPFPDVPDSRRYDRAKERLTEFFDKKKFLGVKVECVIGDPGSEIVDFAKKISADLIVIPSHGRTGLARVMLGSVAERVLRLAPCPVLVLRRD